MQMRIPESGAETLLSTTMRHHHTSVAPCQFHMTTDVVCCSLKILDTTKHKNDQARTQLCTLTE